MSFMVSFVLKSKHDHLPDGLLLYSKTKNERRRGAYALSS